MARKKVPAVNATPPPGSNTSIDSSSDDDHGGGTQGWEHKVVQYGEFVSLGFPVWVALASVVALVRPQALAWVDSRVQFFGIVLTMLGMGMTLSFKDFEGALTMPKQLVAGVVLQYTVMPAAGVVMARLLHLPAHYAAGLVLVACCPGWSPLSVSWSVWLAGWLLFLLVDELLGEGIVSCASGIVSCLWMNRQIDR